MTGSIPTLVTERLILRALAESDLDAYAEMMADPDVTRFLGDGKPLARPDAWRQLAFFLGHWELRGFGIWAVEHRTSGTFIGRIGCYEPEGWPGFEIGYALARPFWGQGYATEGVTTSLTYARETLRRDRIISLIRPANVPSIRVAERLGAALEGETEFFGQPARIYVYPRGAAA